jgi:predicted enzyme related to lactoylglutathione lyase
LTAGADGADPATALATPPATTATITHGATRRPQLVMSPIRIPDGTPPDKRGSLFPVGDDWARPVVHWEITARDPERQRAFYRQLFNWDIGDGAIMTIEPGLGGPEPGPGGHIRQDERSGVTLYVQVRDLRASLVEAGDLGATVVAPPFDIPGGPTLAIVTDPEGNPLVLVQQ